MIIKTQTIDKQGRTYNKIFSNFFQDAIICSNKINNVFEVKPNIAIREGDSQFGNQLVFQLVIQKEKEQYNSKENTPKGHIETYFKIDKETITFFEELLKELKLYLK
jgi:hypothetical protein